MSEPGDLIQIYEQRSNPRPAPTLSGNYRLALVDENLLPHVIGMLELLMQEITWTGDKAQIETVIQEITDICVCLHTQECVNVLEDIRIENGNLEKKPYNGDWQQVGIVSGGGTGITSAAAFTLPAGSPATAALNGTQLELGIPAGQDGIDGVNGVDGTDGAAAPVPVFEFQTNPEGEIKLYVDANANGGWDAISPNLRGEDGIDGVNGVDGQDGAPGQDGIDGGNPEIRIFTDEQTQEDWIQWKHSNQVIWNDLIELSALQGPMGPQGLQGIQGAQGIQGSIGPAGEDGECPDCPKDVKNAFYTLPPTTDVDINCRAAWQVASAITDDVRDFIELVDLTDDTVLETVDTLAGIFVDAISLGLLGSASSDVVEIVAGATTEAVEYVSSTIIDPNVKSILAEAIFCRLQEGYSGLGTLFVDAVTHLDLPSAPPTFPLDPLAWLNMLDWINFAVSAGETGVAAFCFAYCEFSRLAADYLDWVTPVDDLIASAAQTALFFDSRDCASFSCFDEVQEWEHTFDFSTSDHAEHIQIVAGTWDGSKLVHVNEVHGLPRRWCRVELQAPPNGVTFDAIEMTYSVGSGSFQDGQAYEDNVILTDQNGAGDSQLLSVNTVNGNQELQFQVRSDSAETLGELTGYAYIHSITVFGTGTNPFI